MRTTSRQHRRVRSAALTAAEIVVLAELAQGSTLGLAGRRLGISARTIRRRVRNACDAIGVNTPIQAVVWAAKHGLI